jgi:hypothetical protein
VRCEEASEIKSSQERSRGLVGAKELRGIELLGGTVKSWNREVEGQSPSSSGSPVGFPLS